MFSWPQDFPHPPKKGRDTYSFGFHLLNLREGRRFVLFCFVFFVVLAWVKIKCLIEGPLPCSGYWSALNAEAGPYVHFCSGHRLAGVPEPRRDTTG